MSGHSKWSTIKHKKAAKDQEKAKVFSKLSRVVTIAVLEGGGVTDPEKNVKLRLAIERAKAANMPKDNIKKAIEKGIGPDKDSLKEITYEGFGPSGVNLLIHVTTDNTNRTIAEVRNTLEKNGGKLGNQGSVAYLFKKCGYVVFDKSKNQEDAIFTFAEAIQSFDMEDAEGMMIVYFPFENMGRVASLTTDLVAVPPELDYKADLSIKVTNPDDAQKITRLVEALEDLDDVQQVYGNFEI